ncbi:MAG: radical SAM protein [Thermoprotei archaeon]|nr:radical SAM protein [Thermoprotei archaeon]
MERRDAFLKFSLSQKEIKVGGPTPELKEGEQLIRKTQSLCPECYRLLPAIIFEREGKAWIRRICPEHGEIEELYWGDADLLRRAFKYEVPPRRIKIHEVGYDHPCPFSCGLCPMHLNYTALVNLVATNRCDLSCWYCFFYAERAGFVYEPSLEQIRRMLSVPRKQYPHGGLALQITGGEPLLRDDLVDIVRIAKELGYTHIQLNTNGLRFIGKGGMELSRSLRESGVNTIYLSFDAVSPINFKNHWEVPYILEVFRKTNVTSVVLVPTVIRNWNTSELGDIIKFAAENIDVIRGVNFQPISITGRVPRSERMKYRITIPDTISLIEEETDGEIPRDAWYPVPVASIFASFLEAFTGRPYLQMRNHPACGMATYVYVERHNGKVVGFKPITEFIDVAGLLDYLKEKTEELRRGGNRYLVGLKVLYGLRKFIHNEKLPEGLKLWNLLYNIFIRHDYGVLGVFHYKFLFLGMMHFMDLYNYDVQRVMRCNIHYVVPDGRIVPFCAFNVLSDLYRDSIQKQYSVPLEKWIELKGKDTVGDAIKYKRDVKKLESGEIYRRTYASFMDSWRK